MNTNFMKQTSKRLDSRLGTSNPIERPTTTKAAGYSKSLGKDPRELDNNKSKFLFAKKEPTTKEQIIKEFEKNIQKLWDDSIILKCRGELITAKEKCLMAHDKLLEFKSRTMDYFNTELEFGIKLNLALIYEAMKMYDEARAIYTEIIQQENYYTPGIQFQKVRINLGNLYYLQGEYKKAITEWKKAIDKLSKENKEMRGNVLRNIANAHIKLGSFTDAIDNYTESFKMNQDVKTAMNLLLSDLAVDKIDHTKHVFGLMLDTAALAEKEIDTLDESKQIDPLKEHMIMKRKENLNIIVNIALVMSHYLDKDPLAAFDYIIETIKRSGIRDAMNEIEMAKAMYFLKRRDVDKTISIMKSFENKNKTLISRVSNNISFLYFVEGDITNAEKYANLALENERYNHRALVNKGNIHFSKEDYMKAKEFYLEAIGVQSDCIEAIYNLGMVNIRMEGIYEAIQAFEKLNSVVPNIPEVLYKIAKLYEYMKQFEDAIKYYSLLLIQLPNDPILLSSLGSLYYQINPKEERMYMHYFEDSYRYFPSNFDNLIVLGFLYFKEEIYEKAINFFELASKVQPNAYTAEIQYAKCFYKLGKYRESLRAFRRIHNKYPDNKEALTFLIATSKELGLSYDEYNQKLIKLEREQITMGQPDYEYEDNAQLYGNNLVPQQINNEYKGESVDFSKYSNKNSLKQKNSSTNSFMKFEQRPEELLP